jgi:flavodoxin
MSILIIYNSTYGNTEKIARAIGSGISGEVKVLRANEAKISDLESVNLLIIGSPTQGGRPTPAVQQFFNNIPTDGLKNIKVAAFDTRFSEKDSNLALRLVMKTVGYAAGKIAKILEGKGGKLAVPPEGFIVSGKKGPLKEGELERAMVWAKSLVV